MKRKRRGPGRPPRTPGHDYTIEDIPMQDYLAFKKFCANIDLTMRDALITLIRHAKPLLIKK